MTSKGPAVLAAGIPAHHSLVPAQQQEFLGKMLKDEEARMYASGYDFEILYVMPEDGIDEFKQKLRERDWKAVLIGRGLRTIDSLIPVLEDMVNATRETCPNAKICFNASVGGMLEAFERVLPLGKERRMTSLHVRSCETSKMIIDLVHPPLSRSWERLSELL